MSRAERIFNTAMTATFVAVCIGLMAVVWSGLALAMIMLIRALLVG